MVRTGKSHAVEGPSEVEGQGNSSRPILRQLVPRISQEALFMQEEMHQRLQWPGCDQNRKIELNNNFNAPRLIDWNVCPALEISATLDEFFQAVSVQDEIAFGIPICKRAFYVKEDVYLEWCLEFYSSLKVEKKFKEHRMHCDKLIKFRLGGKEHDMTLPHFGYLAGLFTPEEVENTRPMSYYIAHGETYSTGFYDFG